MRSPHTANFLTCHDLRAPLVIVARPALDAAGKPVPARFDAVLGTTVIVAAGSRSSTAPAPCLAARHRSGHHDHLKHIGSEVESLRGRIGAAAKLTVDEDSTPRFKRWKPFSRGAVQPSMRETAPLHAEGRTGTQNRAGAEV